MEKRGKVRGEERSRDRGRRVVETGEEREAKIGGKRKRDSGRERSVKYNICEV